MGTTPEGCPANSAGLGIYWFPRVPADCLQEASVDSIVFHLISSKSIIKIIG